MRLAAVILWALLNAAAFGQLATNAETRFIVSGIDGYKIVGEVILAPETAKLQLQAVGYFEVKSAAAIVKVKASDSRNMPVEVKELGPGAFIVLGSGTVRVEVTIVDFDKRLFDQDEFQITIGKAPDPTPGPVDPVPPNQDLARISREAASKLNDPSTALALAAAINETATSIDQQCQSGQCPGLAQCKAMMVTAIEGRLLMRTGSSLNVDWLNGWRVPINNALKSLNTSDVPTYLASMRSVASGLKAN